MKWSSTTCRVDAIIIRIYFKIIVEPCTFDQTQKPFLVKLLPFGAFGVLKGVLTSHRCWQNIGKQQRGEEQQRHC